MARFLGKALFLALVAWPAFAGDPSPQALIKAGHWKRARTLLERLDPPGHNEPDSAETAYLLSQVKLAFGDLDGALKLAEKAVALDGANSGYHFQLAAACGETAERASLFSKALWARRFKEEADKAAALDSKNLEARFALIEYYLQAPRLMGGGKEKAYAMADEIGKIDPAHGFLARVRLAQEEKNATQEEAFYLKALAAGPRNYEVLVSLANFYSHDSQRKFDLAEKYARQAVRVDASQIEAYSSLAAVYALGGRWNELDATLAEAEKQVPDDLSPHFRAGRALLDSGTDLPRAERYFRKYLSQEPEADAPTLAHAHWQLGLALEKQQHKPEAVSEVQTAVRLKPDLQEAKKDLARLTR